MVSVKAGQNLPLSVTIGDRTAGLVVKATLEKMDGTILSTVTLAEAHDGDHLHNSFPMPSDVDFLKAKFRVYDSDGTTPNATNGDFDEIFGLIDPPSAVHEEIDLDLEEPEEVFLDIELEDEILLEMECEC